MTVGIAFDKGVNRRDDGEEDMKRFVEILKEIIVKRLLEATEVCYGNGDEDT